MADSHNEHDFSDDDGESENEFSDDDNESVVICDNNSVLNKNDESSDHDKNDTSVDKIGMQVINHEMTEASDVNNDLGGMKRKLELKKAQRVREHRRR